MSIPETRTGKSGGFDFGLKTFLTDDEGRVYTSPQFFAHNFGIGGVEAREVGCEDWSLYTND